MSVNYPSLFHKKINAVGKRALQLAMLGITGNLDIIQIMEFLIGSTSSIKDAIFWSNFIQFLSDGSWTDEERDIFTSRLFEDEEKKEENARRIILILYQAETRQKVNYILNATHSLNHFHINQSQYFRICNLIVNTLSEDLRYLQRNIILGKDFCFCEEVQGLLNQGLMTNANFDWGNLDDPDEDNSRYEFTSLARLVDKYALSYNSGDRYPELYFKTQEKT